MKEDILHKFTGVYVNKETYRNAASCLVQDIITENRSVCMWWRERDRQRERQTDRERERQTETERERETEDTCTSNGL